MDPEVGIDIESSNIIYGYGFTLKGPGFKEINTNKILFSNENT